MAVMALLLTAGMHGLGDAAAHARRGATDSVISLVEQAHATAISSRGIVVLALADPGDVPGGDERGRLGLFKIKDWPAGPATLEGTLICRWLVLPRGVVLLPGAVNGLRNPRDEPQSTIRYLAGTQPVQGRFHILAFSPRGALLWPAGSDPLALRLGDGGRRHGQPVPNSCGESCLKIGRVTARPYPFDR
jgi:hypothetical protein